MSNYRANVGSNGAQYIKKRKYVFKAILMAALKHATTRMWANAQRDGRPAEYRWRPLFNAAKFG